MRSAMRNALGSSWVTTMTVIVVTHELPSAFRIADRIAMLYQGSFSSVGTKDEIKASQNPRVRQFLDRIPENIAKMPGVAAYFEKYMQSEVNQ